MSEEGHGRHNTLTASLTLLWPTMITTGGSPMAANVCSVCVCVVCVVCVCIINCIYHGLGAMHCT